MRLAVAVAGMPGAGKGSVSAIAESEGFQVFVCGDVVREEAQSSGVAPDRKNLGRIMFELREKEGPAVIIQRMMRKIGPEKPTLALIEGVRSLDEVSELRRHYTVYLVAVHASPRTRFERLKRRGREDDPKTLPELDVRDRQELKVGLGNVIALADLMLVNESSLTAFRTEIRKVLREVKKNGRLQG